MGMRRASDLGHRTLPAALGAMRIGAAMGVVALGLQCGPAAAHPHVWATVRSVVVIGPNDTITAIRHTWTFDKFYSAMAIQGLDTNHDGIYSRQELQPLADINVKSLKPFKYFTFVSVKGKKIALNEPVDYWVTCEQGIVTLHFTLPLTTPLAAAANPVKIEVYDPTFFVAFGFATKDPVALDGPAAKDCKVKIELPDPDQASAAQALTESFFAQLGPNSNYGSQFAQTAIVSCKS
jgi:ABC-type uncharacterized transport system substrate-binding protein